MTFSIEPADKGELEWKANDAERTLLHTLDVLAERRRKLSAVLSQARAKLESGALLASVLLAAGAASLLRRPHGSRARVRPIAGAGALFLLGVSIGLLTLARRSRGTESVTAR